FRLYQSDIERECDFMIFNDGFGTFEDLMEHWWMIYTMTDKYVYFVRIPADQILSIGSVDRLAEFYHTAADRLARMDSSAFKNAVSSTIPPSKGRVVMLHSPPCCGGSLLGGMLRSIDQTQRRLLVHG
ncbi:hypothetical protein Angca_000159, partial [Angiostrongylus cantonensis]